MVDEAAADNTPIQAVAPIITTDKAVGAGCLHDRPVVDKAAGAGYLYGCPMALCKDAMNAWLQCLCPLEAVATCCE